MRSKKYDLAEHYIQGKVVRQKARICLALAAVREGVFFPEDFLNLTYEDLTAYVCRAVCQGYVSDGCRTHPDAD